MSKFKNFKQKFLQSPADNRRLTQNGGKSSSTSTDHVALDGNQVTLLTKWLEQLNQQQLITITEQNDIVIMAGGENDQAQQIFINSDHVNAYMESKMGSRKTMNESDIIGMPDIARILLKYGYVDGSSGQLSFSTQTIALDSNELKWLISIVRAAQPDPQSRETHVKLFDGGNTQILHIPYECMAPTDDIRTVATYLFRNGHVRYDVDTETYAYRYVEPDILLDDKSKSSERVRQRQLLSFHIHHIHVDGQKERVALEFLHEPTHRLVLPTRWYRQILAHGFDRDYIIDILLANGGVIDRDTFVFMGRTYSLQGPRVTRATSHLASPTNLKTVNLSSTQKDDLIRRYIDLIIKQDGAKQDDTSKLILLENATDGRQLYFTPEHSQWIRQNQWQRQDVIDVLVKHGQIKQNDFGNYLLYYNNQHIKLPPLLIPSSTASSQKTGSVIRSLGERFCLGIQQPSRSTTPTTTADHVEARFPARLAQETQETFIKRYHNTIDYMCRHGLVTWDKSLKLIRLHFSDETLLIPLNHLRPIIDPRLASSSSTIRGGLPFNSRQLAQWLLTNSYIKRNTY